MSKRFVISSGHTPYNVSTDPIIIWLLFVNSIYATKYLACKNILTSHERQLLDIVRHATLFYSDTTSLNISPHYTSGYLPCIYSNTSRIERSYNVIHNLYLLDGTSKYLLHLVFTEGRLSRAVSFTLVKCFVCCNTIAIVSVDSESRNRGAEDTCGLSTCIKLTLCS